MEQRTKAKHQRKASLLYWYTRVTTGAFVYSRSYLIRFDFKHLEDDHEAVGKQFRITATARVKFDKSNKQGVRWNPQMSPHSLIHVCKPHAVVCAEHLHVRCSAYMSFHRSTEVIY